MAVISAGVLIYRQSGVRPEFLLGHPGGPLWPRKGQGAWMIFKGLIEAGDDTVPLRSRSLRRKPG